jgi:light-regulated signal transduction histidine kinase (bacteriophytochrome)
VVGAAMFFKDLTRVEQLEERERLRDRLAALGEMAAAIAHEVKNPLAGIEVMAGLLRAGSRRAPDAQAVLSDIIAEAKMANAIVQEVLEFVRPMRCRWSGRPSPTPCRRRCSWPTRRQARRRRSSRATCRRTCRDIQATSTSWHSCSRTCS